MTAIRVATITVSDRASAGVYDDKTGPAVIDLLGSSFEIHVTERMVVGDEMAEVADHLRKWCDEDRADLILTNGGTGLGRRDVTPEATLAIIDRQVPGIAEAMRAAGRAVTPLADVSRQVAGQRRRTLVVNLPGSVKGATESLTSILGVLPHAVEMIRAET